MDFSGQQLIEAVPRVFVGGNPRVPGQKFIHAEGAACGARTSLLLHSKAAADLSERLGLAWNAASTGADRELVISDTHAGDDAVLDALADAGETIQKSGEYPGAMARFQLFLAIATRIQDDHHIATGLQLIGGQEGLSWALLVSGVPSSVVSQGRVESVSTTELMVVLHRFVSEKAAPAEALRHSILAVMKNERYRHPFYWGAFVSVGD